MLVPLKILADRDTEDDEAFFVVLKELQSRRPLAKVRFQTSVRSVRDSLYVVVMFRSRSTSHTTQEQLLFSEMSSRPYGVSGINTKFRLVDRSNNFNTSSGHSVKSGQIMRTSVLLVRRRGRHTVLEVHQSSKDTWDQSARATAIFMTFGSHW